MKKIILGLFAISTMTFANMEGAKSYLQKILWDNGTPLIRTFSTKQIATKGNINVYEIKGEYREKGKAKKFVIKVRDTRKNSKNIYEIINY